MADEQPQGTERSEEEIQELMQTWFTQALEGEVADDILVEVLAVKGPDLAMVGKFPQAAWYHLQMLALSRILALALDAGGAVVESATVEEVDDIMSGLRAQLTHAVEWMASLVYQLDQAQSVLPSTDNFKSVRQQCLAMMGGASMFCEQFETSNELQRLGLSGLAEVFLHHRKGPVTVSVNEKLGQN